MASTYVILSNTIIINLKLVYSPWHSNYFLTRGGRDNIMIYNIYIYVNIFYVVLYNYILYLIQNTYIKLKQCFNNDQLECIIISQYLLIY